MINLAFCKQLAECEKVQINIVHLPMITDSRESYDISAVDRRREDAIFGIISAANVAEYFGELYHPIFHCTRHVFIHCN